MKIITIITTKNRPTLFHRALKSVINQIRKPDSLIVVSDSDKDNVILEKQFVGEQGIFLNDMFTHNYAGSLNTALYFIVKTQLFTQQTFDDCYIALIDDDDFWHRDYLSKCENAIRYSEDFVVSGLIYRNENGNQNLSIPQSLSIDDFLKGNPHIQGSNTFVKFSTLMKAGLFDENMSSTTDRDVFTRIMMLNPRFAIVNEYLVEVDAYNRRERITTGTDKKTDGLRKFYYKYNGFMSDDTKRAFFERSQRLFGISKEDIITIKKNTKIFNPPEVAKKYSGKLLIGFIATEYKHGLRLLRQLCELRREKTKIVILINFTNDIDEYSELLSHSGYEFSFITREGIKTQIASNGDQFIKENLIQEPIIKDIAITRSILQQHLYEMSGIDEVIWILDDDMEIKELRLLDRGLSVQPTDIDIIIEKYRNDYDAVIGNYSLDAPLPTLSTIRCTLLDYVYNQLGKIDSPDTLYTHDDYYYDLSETHRTHLETPLKIDKPTNIERVFSGKAIARPLYVLDDSIKEVKSRGGNTLIFNRELLRIPNWSLQVADKIGRRSDYFWVLQAQNMQFKLASVPFAVYHNRCEVTFDYKKEENKLLLDIIGASFTKATEEVGVSANEQLFYDAYSNHFLSRLTMYYLSYYRVIGLLSILQDTKYSNFFTPINLNAFIKDAKTYLQYASVISSYNSLCCKIHMQLQMESKDYIENEIQSIFNITLPLLTLGNGGEGVAFTDKQSVYKWFFAKPKNWIFLQNICETFKDCEQLYSIHIHELNGKYIISYPFENSTPYQGGHALELASLIRFCKENGYVFTNIKKENFVVVNGRLKLIDYGKSFEPFTEDKYNRSLSRAYELVRYPFLNEEEFKHLIQLSYLGKTEAIDSGCESFRKLVLGRFKEDLHDGIIRNFIKKYQPRNILDYGAGKCKIANSLCGEYEFTAFDIDISTVKMRANKKIHIFDKVEDLPNDHFDMILSNLVLCCVDDTTARDIISKMVAVLKINGKAIISICNPFYNNIQHTELRSSGLKSSYFTARQFDKNNYYGTPIRKEYHRPIEFYINLLQRNGFRIDNVVESEGINTDSLLAIGEHLVFDCSLISKPSILQDCSLLIKANPMEANCIYDCIKHIVSSLEKSIQFMERIVVLDTSTNTKRTRRYAEDDLEFCKTEIQRALKNGLIDRICAAPQEKEKIQESYKQYFNVECHNPNSANGQGLYATIYGFDEVQTDYVFQTDSDILYFNEDSAGFLRAYKSLKNSTTVSLSIPHHTKDTDVLGCRTEVRSCFLNLYKLKNLLPLQNSTENGIVTLPWHRALDQKLACEESARLVDDKLWFIHPANNLKLRMNFVERCRDQISLGRIPSTQYSQVDLCDNAEEWAPHTTKKIVIYMRGYNTSCERLRRAFQSIKQQNVQDFEIVYLDDGSINESQEYARFILENDKYFEGKVIAVYNKHNVGELENFVFVMQNVVMDKNTVVINLDNDDYFVSPYAIERIIEEFEKGAEVTCGNCFRYDKPLKHYTIHSFDKVWERGGDNIWLHPKCFKRKLFDSIDIENDLKIDGNYIEVNTDFAIMLPMLESAEKNVFIDDIIYYFEPSVENQNSRGKYSQQYKNEIRERLLKKAKEKHKE